jgi:hypothetical protein
MSSDILSTLPDGRMDIVMDRLMMENSPMSSGLAEYDLSTKRSRIISSTRAFRRLCNANSTELSESGLECIQDGIILEDRSRFGSLLEESVAQMVPWSIIVRLLREDEGYHWTRFMFNPIQHLQSNSSVYISMVCEDYTEDVDDIEIYRRSYCAASLLDSFLRAVFDVDFFVDSEFHITDPCPRLAHFLGGPLTPTGSPVCGTAFEEYIAIEEDKSNFRDFVNSLNCVHFPPSDPTRSDLPTAPMIRLRLKKFEPSNSVIDVRLFAVPAIRPSGSSDAGGSAVSLPVEPPLVYKHHYPTSSNQSSSSRYYKVGLLAVNEFELCDSFKEKHSKIMDELSSALDGSSRQQPEVEYTLMSSCGSSGIDEEVVGPGTVSARSHTSGKICMLVQKDLFVVSLYRSLSRDLSTAITEIDRSTQGSNDWLTPLFQVGDRQVVEECISILLPHTLQAKLVNAIETCDFEQCALLLESSVSGNCNIFGNPKNFNPLDMDTTHTVFRFFCILASDIVTKGGEQRLSRFCMLIERLFKARVDLGIRLIGNAVSEVVLFELTLTTFTVAQKFPHYFANKIQSLRNVFTEALGKTEVSSATKTSRLPPVYWICILWGSLQKKLDRAQEGIAVLTNLFDDISTFCKRLPESSSMRSLQAITSHNLCVESINSKNLIEALKWSHALIEITTASHAHLPKKCLKLITWAKNIERNLLKLPVNGDESETSM